ncbi:hypothetical protein Lal_00040003 [Lupinus albus]|nr:hypothetical protein Lal_00040003 [Lupinus albus]
MDELVSLRSYITTRMDAFDTQSHQIQYELHCLSSRLSNMDIDEDSSEPEGRKVRRNAHNSKRKGEHTCIHIGGAYSRQVKIYHQVYFVFITGFPTTFIHTYSFSQRFSPLDTGTTIVGTAT